MGERKKEAISGDFNGPRLSVVIKGQWTLAKLLINYQLLLKVSQVF